METHFGGKLDILVERKSPIVGNMKLTLRFSIYQEGYENDSTIKGLRS